MSWFNITNYVVTLSLGVLTFSYGCIKEVVKKKVWVQPIIFFLTNHSLCQGGDDWDKCPFPTCFKLNVSLSPIPHSYGHTLFHCSNLHYGKGNSIWLDTIGYNLFHICISISQFDSSIAILCLFFDISARLSKLWFL